MIRGRIRLFFCAILALVLAAGMACAEVYIDQEKPEDWEERDLLRVYALCFLDNDAFVLECGGKTMLIDGGTGAKENALTDFLAEHGMLHLDMIYNSHPHDDHLEAVYFALRDGRITTDLFLSPFRENYIAYDDLELHKKTVSVLKKKEIPFRQLLNGDEVELGEARAVLYRYDGDTKKPDGGSMMVNDMSGILWVRYGETAILFTADIGGMIQKMLAADYGPEGLKSDILTAPHHGKNAVNGDLLKAVEPKLTVITGKVARTEDCRQQMESMGIEWKKTSYGEILMETDGKDWYVNQEDKYGELEKMRKQKKK